jgi:hypothetical protein
MTDRKTDLGRAFALPGDAVEVVEDCEVTAFADGDVMLKQGLSLVYLSHAQMLRLVDELYHRTQV